MIGRIAQAKKNGKYIVIVGCSPAGNKIATEISNMDSGIKVIFADNDEKKQIKGNCGFEVIAPEDIPNIDYEICVVASVRFFEELTEQLYKLNIKDTDIFYVNEIMERKIDIQKDLLKKRFAKKELNFVVDLAEHCNLNCQSCDHFSPLAEEKYTDIEEFKSDIQRISVLFNNDTYKITHVDLEGGEPLLNGRVTDYIEIVHEYMPESIVKIFTNGLLLSKQSQKFWDVCRQHKVVLEVTKYPINFDYTQVENIALNNSVKLEYFSGGETIKTSSYKPLDLEGIHDKYESFMACYMGNGDCPMLKHGHLYPCTVVPNLSTFNRYFSKSVEVCSRDSINIYEAKTAEEIMDFLANPIPACRYCQPEKWKHGCEWNTTKYDIKEWAE